MPQNIRDFNSMQEEALRRMREMQKRSKTYVNTEAKAPPPRPQSAPEPTPRRQDILGSLLGDIKIDPERAMLLLMLLILYKNKADMKLILALGYLLI